MYSLVSQKAVVGASVTAYRANTRAPESAASPYGALPAGYGASQVLFNDYDAVQSEIYWVRDLGQYDAKNTAKIGIYNSYFGGGMGSVVFQTIRESKALAYSTYAFVQTPSKKEDDYTFVGYVGSQADKMNDAVKGMNELLNVLPRSDKNFASAKISLKNNLETERITKDGILFTYLAAQRKGIHHDIRKDEYQAINKMTFEDIQKFHQQELAEKPYTYCIVASEDKVKDADLQKMGAVKKLNLDEIFGY